MNATPTTGGKAPSPEAEALPTLPVVAWQGSEGAHTFISDVAKNANSAALWSRIYSIPLTPHAPAEAAIVALRAEVAELRKQRDALQEKVRDYALQLMVDEAQAMGLYDAPASLLGDGGTL